MVHREHPHLVFITCVASVMAMLAGFVNAFCIVTMFGSVSGVTGTTSRAGVAFSFLKDGLAGLFLVLQVLAFMGGSMFGGYIAPARKMTVGLPYGFAFIVESIFLFTATALLKLGYTLEPRFPTAFAMGVQNGEIYLCCFSFVKQNKVLRLITPTLSFA
jgi:hypothetical protein